MWLQWKYFFVFFLLVLHRLLGFACVFALGSRSALGDVSAQNEWTTRPTADYIGVHYVVLLWEAGLGSQCAGVCVPAILLFATNGVEFLWRHVAVAAGVRLNRWPFAGGCCCFPGIIFEGKSECTLFLGSVYLSFKFLEACVSFRSVSNFRNLLYFGLRTINNDKVPRCC